MIYLQLFFIFMKISIFSFSGAYSFLPIIEKEIVEKYNWLDKKEFLDVLGIIEISPGAISIKFATYVGFKKAGIFGALAANLGNFILPLGIMILITVLYKTFRRLHYFHNALEMINISIIAMILAIGIKFLINTPVLNGENYTVVIKIIILITTFFLFMFSKIHPAYLIVINGIIGVLLKWNNE